MSRFVCLVLMLAAALAFVLTLNRYPRATSGARITIYSVVPAGLPKDAGDLESAWRSPLDWAELQLGSTAMTSWLRDSFPAGDKYTAARDRALTLDQPGRLVTSREVPDTLTLTVFDADPQVAAQLCDGLFRYLQTISRQQLEKTVKEGGRWEEGTRAAEAKVLSYEQQFQAELSQPRHAITPFALGRYSLNLQSLAAQRQLQRRRDIRLSAAAPHFIVLEPPTTLESSL